MGKPLYSKNFNVRVTDTLAKRIERAAQEDERKPAEWIREVLRKALDAVDKRKLRAAK